MLILDKISFKGEFTIRIRDALSGRLLKEEHYKNLVCVGTQTAVLRLMSQLTTPADYEQTKLWAIYCGTGTTPPTTSDTTLETTVFKKACDTPFTVDLVAGYIEVQMTIESAEGNGNTITEAGLFSRGDNADPNAGGISGVLMYTRQIHGAVAKTAAISVEYTWRFQVTV